jgi:hypothetical protein
VVELAVILFVLRVISALLLIGLLIALLALLWRDYRRALSVVGETRRAHGLLVALHEVDGGYAMSGDVHPLLPLTSLGRAPTNTVQVNTSFASGEHALIARRGGQWWLEDRGSRNGTMLNGALISRPVVVTNGDIIGIGTHLFRIDLES